MKLDLLKDILLPPLEPQDVDSINDWESIERKLGTQLPDDYKSFIDLYGLGTIDRFLVVFNPFSSNKFVNLLDRGRRILQAFDISKKEFPKYYSHPLFPSPGGLLPFAGTDNGDVLYWRTTGTPENWTVTVFDPRSPDYFDFNGPMTDFLIALLTRSVECKVFPRGFPSGPPRFIPIAPKP